MKIYNLSLHVPTPEMVEWGKKQGNIPESLFGGRDVFHETERDVVFSEPHGVFIEACDGLTVRELAQASVYKAKEQGFKYLLVGGLSDVTFHQIATAHRNNMVVFVAVTKRIRDENARFVFVFSGLRKVWKDEVVEYE